MGDGFFLVITGILRNFVIAKLWIYVSVWLHGFA